MPALAGPYPRIGSVLAYPALDFSGGKNSRAAKTLLSDRAGIRPNQLVRCENWDLDESGGLTKRTGRVKLNATALAPAAGTAVVSTLYELRQRNGSRFALATAGNSIYKLNAGQTGFDLLGTVPTANRRFQMATLSDLCAMVNGVDAPQKYTGGAATAALLGSPPIGAVIASYANRLWIGAVVGSELTLYHSALGAPEDWTTANNAGSLPVPATRSYTVRGLFPFYNRLIIWCDNEIFQLTGTGPSTFALSPLNTAYGLLNGACIAPTDNDLAFASPKGLHTLSTTDAQSQLGDIQQAYLTWNIEPDYRAATRLASQQSAAFLLNYRAKNSLLLFCPSASGGQNSQAMVGDYNHLDEDGRPAWRDYTNQPFACGMEAELTAGVVDVVLGDYSGYVYKLSDIATDAMPTGNPVPISATATYLTALETVDWEKTVRRLKLYTNGIVGADATLSLTATCDFKTMPGAAHPVNLSVAGGDLLGSTFTLGRSMIGHADVHQHTVNFPCFARYLELTITSNTAHAIKFYGMIIYARLRRLLA